MPRDTVELSDELRHRIRQCLEPLHPDTVIVFGSYAGGAADRDSDIDLLRELTDVYTDCRYPGDIGLTPRGKPTDEDAARFEQFAEHVHETVLSTLS